jgi:predicted deacylase
VTPLAREPFKIAGQTVSPGKRASVEFPVARLPGESTPQMLPCVVLHGKEPGPTVFVCGAIHGDEITGTAIIRRLMDVLSARTLAGTVLLLPVVNLFGFTLDSRYLPDRRDLNRCFPGSMRGSLGGRLARLFMDEVVARSDYGLDLHSGSDHRTNAPQIRADLDQPEHLALAKAFGAGIALHAKLRAGSLREAAGKVGVPTVTYEGGVAQRFDAHAIAVGLRGVQRVLAHVRGDPPAPIPTWMVRKTKWLRARRSGIFWPHVEAGDPVEEGQPLGRLTDILGKVDLPIVAPADGVVLGLNLHPPVHQGDALINLGIGSTIDDD